MGVPATNLLSPSFLKRGVSRGLPMILVLAGIWIIASSPVRASDLALSLKEAVEWALSGEGSAAVQMAQELMREVEARSRQSRAELLPHLEASIGQQEQTRNLEALGLRPSLNFRPPTLVGPFSTFDARARLTQSIFNLSSTRRFQASRSAVLVAKSEQEKIQDQVASQVARSYLEGLRNRARLDAARANLDLAVALADLAESQRAAGSGTRIEVTRAQVQLSHEEQLALAAEHAYQQSLLKLLKLIGLPLDVNLTLTESLDYVRVEIASLSEAMAIALGSRPDLRARQEREQHATLNYRAAQSERFPSLTGFAGYGTIGSSISNTIPTWDLGISLQLPLFDGGRFDARRAESSSKLRQERIERQDLRRQIELEVRLALAGLRLAEEQIKVAEEGLQLAQQELDQGRRRYQSGITTNIEVTDAQARLARAKENHITALFNFNFERVNLAEAMGTIRSMIQ